MWVSAPLLQHIFHAAALVLLLPAHVTARFCEGGHICSLPRECCTQGCCPPYQGGPRQLPPPSEHVLNLFFISHWFFWCVVVAVILAILCAYSLWKKRRTLCGWGFTEHRTQSEGDSAGSCYAPPQYSRCNSFHHPPPPYTEVTSKPDLYPLVFTCNNDGSGKGNGNGSSYLMVQYFRNYIVRPAGSLSAASTVDSLSSSFICNANEANTLVPPPYSRAASPDLGMGMGLHYAPSQPAHSQGQSQALTQYALPRSASQLVCHSSATQHRSPQAHYTTVALNEMASGAAHYNTRLHASASESGHFSPDESGGESSGSANHQDGRNSGSSGGVFLQSQSDQHFRRIANSTSSLSDIFVNNSCAAGLSGNGGNGGYGGTAIGTGNCTDAAASASLSSLALAIGGTPVIYSNGCIQPNPLHRVHVNPNSNTRQFARKLAGEPVYNSCSSIGGIPLTAQGTDGEYRDLQLLRRSLETCCQLLQQQQQTVPPPESSDTALMKKYGGDIYVTSGTVSGVSSLANIGTPGSPPQATSPTGEVREILDQIRQLQAGVSYEELLISDDVGGVKPRLHHTVTTTAALVKRPAMLQQQPSQPGTTTPEPAAAPAAAKSKKLYTPKPNKALYIPMSQVGDTPPTAANRCVLKSPVGIVSGATFFVNRGRATRKGWISRSAPTTPGTGLPPNRLGDDSPLLNEHDEDAEDPEGEQSAELE